MNETRRYIVAVGLAASLAGCTVPTTPPVQSGRGEQVAIASSPKRIVAATVGDARVFYQDLGATIGAPGDNAIEELLNTGLTEQDDRGVSRPQLAEAVPSIEAGSWVVLSDGRMQTTWTIRPGVQWQDGAAYSTADLVFTIGVITDEELPLRRRPAFKLIDAVEAVDSRTIKVSWTKPFIDADKLFTRDMGMPLPKHILETAAAEDKANFGQLSYWGADFVGTGPFRMKELAPGSRVVLGANKAYALGSPKIDEIEVRFLSEPNALIANILAGGVDLFVGRGMNLDRAMLLEDQWKEGQVVTRLSGLIVIYAQFLNPAPSIVTNVQFRRAALAAIDRPQLVDTLLYGRGAVAHVYLGPNQAEYPDVEPGIVQYPFDPRQSADIMTSMGYVRGADGVYRDTAGQRLTLEMRSEPLETEQKSLYAVVDSMQRVGLEVEPIVIPRQRTNDLEYRYTFPALYLRGHASSLPTLEQYLGVQSPLPENRWAGTNRGRYVSQELDALIDRYYVTIPRPERSELLRGVMRHLSDQLPVLPLFYNTEFTVIANRLHNVPATKAASGAAKTWKSQEWDVD